jgi:hypothetical protein
MLRAIMDIGARGKRCAQATAFRDTSNRTSFARTQTHFPSLSAGRLGIEPSPKMGTALGRTTRLGLGNPLKSY